MAEDEKTNWDDSNNLGIATKKPTTDTGSSSPVKMTGGDVEGRVPYANAVSYQPKWDPANWENGISSANSGSPSWDYVSGYDDIIEELEKRRNQFKPLSEEELKKLRRKQKVEGIISGVADAAQAISNLYYTTRYAPDMYNAKEGLSAKAKERFEREKAEREANDEKYYNYSMQIGKLKDATEQNRWKQQQQQVSLQLKINEDARRQAKADYDAEMADIDLQIKLGKLDYETAKARQMEAKATLEEANAKYADELVLAKINKDNRAYSGRGNAGGKKDTRKYFDVEDKDGNIVRVYMNNLNDYYDQTDTAIKLKHRQTDSWGDQKTPTQEEMKQAVTEHLRTKGNTYRQRSRNNTSTSVPTSTATPTSRTNRNTTTPKIEIDWK